MKYLFHPITYKFAATYAFTVWKHLFGFLIYYIVYIMFLSSTCLIVVMVFSLVFVYQPEA